MRDFDAVIVGGGAAGLFCAGVAGQLGVRVLVLDHSSTIAEKLRISGGGRCNFTNRDLDPRAPHKHFLSDNPQFCRSALARYTPQDFIALVKRHRVPFHEKHKGQLFGDESSNDFVRMLLAECETGRVARWQPCAVKEVRFGSGGYVLGTSQGEARSRALVVATGGLSIPQIGASDFGYRLARQFGIPVVPTRPGLVPFTVDGATRARFADLAGLTLPVRMETGEKKQRIAFEEDLLFTHRGLSGPAALQVSSYWREGRPVSIDLAPGVDLADALMQSKARSRKRIPNELAAWLPARLADAWTSKEPAWQRPVNEAADRVLQQLAESLSRWSLVPAGTEGYRKAEVTVGGVDTRALSSQTMEANEHPGLHFIGEVVDVTGWLGGYNFQWAWASAFACAQALAAN